MSRLSIIYKFEEMKVSIMKINMIGPGAIGSLIGGLLSVKGHTVSFVQNPESENSRHDRYLRIILPDRWLRIEHIQANAAQKADTCLFALKRSQYATIDPDQFKKYAGTDCENVVFFNCDKEDVKTLDHDGTSSVALTLLNAVALQSQDVELSSSDSVVVFEKRKPLKELFSNLKEFGIKSCPVDSIEPYANSFFLFELLFLPVAMCNTTLGYFLSYREGRELALRILNEGLKTMNKLEMQLGKLPVMDPQDLVAKLEKKPEKFDEKRFACDRSYNTLLQSFLLNKKNEVTRINGRLLNLAKNAGIDPVWNWKLVQKVQRVMKFGFYPNPRELMGGID
jgi:ketopantoate reductase